MRETRRGEGGGAEVSRSLAVAARSVAGTGMVPGVHAPLPSARLSSRGAMPRWRDGAMGMR